MTVKFFTGGNFEGECKPKMFTFPDGQPHITLSIFKEDIKGLDYNKVEVHCSIRNPGDLFNLGLVLDVIRENTKDAPKVYSYITVYIYWLFGARMDRRIDESQPNTSDVVVRTLQMYSDAYGVNYKVLDFHNPEILKCRNRNLLEFSQIPITSYFERVYSDFGNSDIYFPDKGAKDRYSQVGSFNILFGKKKRDPSTGKLTGFEFESGTKKSNSVIIFDDIADGCGTFLGHFEILKAMGYESIALYTTHGIYSKGIAVLDKFNAVYSTNSFILGKNLDEDGYPTDNNLRLTKWTGDKWVNLA